ncbi:hypothetical protein ACO0SA_002145 [Hanseniaspora valbyensis]
MRSNTNNNNIELNKNDLTSSSSFQESLDINILPRDYMLSSFNFKLQSDDIIPSTSNLDTNDNLFTFRKYNGFPKNIEPLLNSANVKTLFLKFTRGHWDSHKWGKLPKNGFSSGGSGVELWSLIEAKDKLEAMDNWSILMSQLSGMFCSSFNFINLEKITFPKDINSYITGKISVDTLPPLANGNSYFLMRGSLANEPICTENLSPFLKFLPTKGKVGLASLLDGHILFDSYWNSMSIDLNTVCDFDSERCHYDMEIDINFMINIPKSLTRNKRPTPKPIPAEKLQCDTNKKFTEWECFPLPDKKEYSFFISEIFGNSIKDRSRLNLLSKSNIRVLGIDNDYWNTAIKLNDELLGTANNQYELNTNQPPLYVSRSLTGNSQDKGGLRVTFTNPSQKHDVTINYYETLPWFMRLYVSSLKISSSDENLSDSDLENLITDRFISLSEIRSKPLHLEYTITIPKGTTLTLQFDLEKPLLNYEEYPPDANHGFEIESALVVVLDKYFNNKNYFIRTPTLLLSLATPDFSMPYNVITITSTLMAFCFGLIFNLLTKRVVTVQDSKHLVTDKPLVRIIKKLKSKIKA